MTGVLKAKRTAWANTNSYQVNEICIFFGLPDQSSDKLLDDVQISTGFIIVPTSK